MKILSTIPSCCSSANIALMVNNIRIIFVSLLFASASGLCQFDDSLYTALSENKYKSIFEAIDSGRFSGNVTGYIKLARGRDTIVLDFKGTKSELSIMHDSLEMYDKSTKRYSARTTSGKTSFLYEIYAMSNGVNLSLDGIVYSVSSIDGACDTPIWGLMFNYCSDKNTEFLTLFVKNPIELTTVEELRRVKQLSYPQAYKLAKKIVLLPGSTMVFVIDK